jgi:hypothetical protein
MPEHTSILMINTVVNPEWQNVRLKQLTEVGGPVRPGIGCVQESGDATKLKGKCRYANIDTD